MPDRAQPAPIPAGGASPPPAARRTRPAYGEFAIAVAVLLFGAMIWWQATSIPVSPIYARVGPTVIPLMSAYGLMIMGLALLYAAFRGGWQSEEEAEVPPDLPALAWVFLGFGLNVALIQVAGFTISSVLMFLCITRAFGSRAWLRDTIVAAVFAFSAYFGFARALGINIGAGPLERAIEALFR